jgi:hypothetical protein
MSRAPSSTARSPGGPPLAPDAGRFADVALVRHRDDRAVDPTAPAALELAGAP